VNAPSNALLRARSHLEGAWRRERSLDFALRMVEVELDLARAMLAVDIAEDPLEFADAVDFEMAAWKLYLERLQARAASVGDEAEAEQTVRELRRLLTELGGRLAEFRAAPASDWPGSSEGVRAAIADLEHAADEASAAFY